MDGEPGITLEQANDELRVLGERAAAALRSGLSEGVDGIDPRVTPLIGRGLLDADEQPGAPGVVVLGDDVWQRLFEGRNDVLGSTVKLGRTPVTVVGVMPKGSFSPSARTVIVNEAFVHSVAQRGIASRAVRHRRQHIARLIDESADRAAQPSILAIASGHLRELELSAAIACGRAGRFVALDADAESLREIETQYSGLGVETVHASVRHILAQKVRLESFDFVYAAGLYDYLNDAAAAALTARMFEVTQPGGRVLVPNFAPPCSDRAYLETFMAWELVYRDEYDMGRLVAQIPASQIASYDIYSDPSGSIVYLSIEKAPSACR